MNKKEAIDAYCAGCNHLIYDASVNHVECVLGLDPAPHPDEPEFLYCGKKKEQSK